MGLIGGMARTAVIAGTATAVSNRVSRRQANRWAQAEQADAYQQEHAYDQQYYQQAPPPPPPPAPPPPPPAAAPAAATDRVAQLTQLAELKQAGVLTEEEFAREKARILAS